MPIYDIKNRNKYRLYYDRKKYEIQEDRAGQWVPAKADPDVLIEQIDFEPKYISDFAKVLNSIWPQYLRAASKYAFRRNALLSIMHRAPGILDILKDAPAIGLLLADSYGNGNIGINEAARLVYMPRRDIVKSVGGKGTKSEVKLLSRIVGSSLNADSLRKIRCLLWDDLLKQTATKLRTNRIDEDLLNTIVDEHPYFSYRVFSKHAEKYCGYNQSAANEKGNWLDEKSRIINEINDMERIIQCWPNMDIYRENIQRVESISKLQKYRMALEKKNANRPFPNPPIKESENIRALKTLEEITAEAHEMGNCVLKYFDWIVQNQYYIYKVLKPERATLGISIEAEKYYSIDDLRIKCNGMASAETWEEVKKWFESSPKR